MWIGGTFHGLRKEAFTWVELDPQSNTVTLVLATDSLDDHPLEYKGDQLKLRVLDRKRWLNENPENIKKIELVAQAEKPDPESAAASTASQTHDSRVVIEAAVRAAVTAVFRITPGEFQFNWHEEDLGDSIGVAIFSNADHPLIINLSIFGMATSAEIIHAIAQKILDFWDNDADLQNRSAVFDAARRLEALAHEKNTGLKAAA